MAEVNTTRIVQIQDPNGSGTFAIDTQGRAVGSSSVVSKGNPWVDVSHPDFAPDNTGVLDATSALQAAIDFVHNAGGGTVYVPPGTYLVSGQLNLYSNCVLMGAAPGTTIFQCAGTANLALIDIDAQSCVSVLNLSLRVIDTSLVSSGSYGVRVRGMSSDITFEDVTCDGFGHCWQLNGSSGAAGAQNEVQKIHFGGASTTGLYPTTGTFVLSWYPPSSTTIGTYSPLLSTSRLSYNATSSQVQTALEAIVGVGNVAVTGGPAPAEMLVTFQGALAGVNVQQLRPEYGYTESSPGAGDAGMIGGNVVIERMVWGGQWIHRVRMVRCVARNSPKSTGVALYYVDHLSMIECHATGNKLDGVKFYSQCEDTEIIGGSYCGNGYGLWVAPSYSGGDGLDGYPGCGSLRIIGAEFSDNTANGIQLKNDNGVIEPEDQDDQSGGSSGMAANRLGLCRHIDIQNVYARRNKNGCGLLIINGETRDDSLSVSQIGVYGGFYEENGLDGVSIQGRNITLCGVKARRNHDRGIFFDKNTAYVDVLGCTSVANGSSTSPGIGLYINAKHVRVHGGTYIGVDDDAIRANTDETTLTKYHASNITVGSLASDVKIESVNAPEGTTQGSGRSVQCGANSAGANIRVNMSGTLSPQGSLGTIGSLLYGNIGSLYTKTSPNDASDIFWMRTDDSSPIGSSNPGTGIAVSGGWDRLVPWGTIWGWMTSATSTITAATNASPIQITTSAAHGLSTGSQATIANVTGNTAANGNWTVTVVNSTTFTLNTSTGNGAYVSGGTAQKYNSPVLPTANATRRGARLRLAPLPGFSAGDTYYVCALNSDGSTYSWKTWTLS